MNSTFIRRAPLVFLIVPYFFGILINKYLAMVPVFWVIATVMFLLISVFFQIKNQSAVTVGLIMLSLGGLNHSVTTRQPSNHISHLIDDQEHHFVALVESSESSADDRVKIISRAFIDRKPGPVFFEGKLLIRVRNSSRRYYYGDSLFFRTVLREASPRRNPGEFDYRKYLENHHIYALAYLDEDQIRISQANHLLSIRRLANRVKYGIQDLIARSMSGEPAAILQALLVGVRGEISDETEQAFIDSGVIHVLAVSGLHVGYVSLAIWVITGFLRLPIKPRVIITIIVLAFYVVIVDVKPSVFRAVIMASMVLIAKGWEKQVNIYNSLAAAALIQTLIDPLQLFDMGFQLSFTAVFSIVYIYKRFESLLPEKISEELSSRIAVRYVVQMFMVSLAALLGTIPITVYYFNRIPIVSMVSNLLIIPLIGLIGALGFAQVILGSIWGWINIAYGEVQSILIIILRKIVALFSSLPIAYIEVAQISIFTLIILYIFIFLLINTDRPRVRKTLVLGLLVCGNLLIWREIFEKERLMVTFLDVSQGDAALIQLPNDKTILIDAGDRTFRRNYGELVVAPFLKREGIRKIDLLILTHPHSDHIGGAPTVMREFNIDQIWESDRQGRSKLYKEIQHLADSLHIPVLTPNTGDMVTFSDDLQLYFMHPSNHFLEAHPRGYNDASLVCKLVYGQTSFLFTGDAEKESEAYLCYWNDFLKSTVIKVPHHGSNTSSTAVYIEQVQPDYAVISVGVRNKFNHPAESTLETYRRCNSVIFRTDLEHAVQFQSDGKIVKVVNWN